MDERTIKETAVSGLESGGKKWEEARVVGSAKLGEARVMGYQK